MFTRIILLIIFLSVIDKAVRTRDPIYFVLVGLVVLVVGMSYFAQKNANAPWVRFLFGFRGVRTDVKYMTREELFFSGKKFLTASSVFLIPAVLVQYLKLEMNIIFMGIFFSSAIFFMTLFAGGVYMVIRGVLRKKDYLHPDRDPALCLSFFAIAKDILAQHPDLKHSWSIDDDQDHCILLFPKLDENGFDIFVEVFANQIIVSADGPHVHFERSGAVEETVQQALGFIRDLLSPSMRVISHLSNGKPYKWEIELLKNDQWESIETVGILLYNYFGVKTKRVYQNKVLPVR